MLSVLYGIGQNYSIAHTKIIFHDTSRNNRQIKTNVYFPSVWSGRANESNKKESFPVVVFGHGFVMSAKSYKNIWKALVPEGYIFVIPKKERGIAPSHLDLANDLEFVLSELKKLNIDSTLSFYHKIHTKSAVMGHSMGGGSAVLAAQNEEYCDALINFAAFETKPSAVKAANKVVIPSLVFAGQNDCITPPDKHQIPIFNALQTNNKTYIEIVGGSHCQMAGKNKLCTLAENRCKLKPGISYKQQHEIIARYLVLWLDFILKDKSEAAQQFDNKIITDPDITFRRNIALMECAN